MAATWTPDGSAPLISAQEDAVNVSALVTVQPAETTDSLTALTWSASPPLPTQVVVTPSVAAGTLSVLIPNFADVFPIQEIRYLLAGVPGVVTRWQDLPAEAEDVIAYRPSSLSQRDFVLSVTAQFEVGGSETRDYTIRVTANYSIGRDLLVAAVDARR